MNIQQNPIFMNKNLLHPKNYRIGELFAGAGGMAWGTHKAKYESNGVIHGFTHAWVNDMDKDACDTLAHNLPISKNNVHCQKVEDLDFNTLSPIDGLVFGFPCNDFSVVGDRHGISGHFGGLYIWGVQALKIFKPSFFVAENVSGLGSSGKNDFQIILEALENAGYDIFHHKYKFDEYGVPQSRTRIIIVGFRKKYKIKFEHAKPTTPNNPKTASEALRDIPPHAKNQELTKQSATVIERLEHIRPGQNAFNADLPDHLKLNIGGAKISQIYRRLRPDFPSYTVTGSGGGGTHVYHWDEPRALTNRERARLQSFPDNFEFLGSKESVRKQIGMAVPPDGAKVVFENILKTLVENKIPVSELKKNAGVKRYSRL